jgi:HTH-type transcriptional repressor of NAD biosynthesis genes
VALVLGKFAPLHKGHMLVIETALAEAEETVVAVYETPGYEPPADVRAGWARELYPEAQVLVLSDPQPEGDTEAVSRAYAEHFRHHYTGPITHVYTSEDYGPRFARYLGAEHVAVDPDRQRIPVSGTDIRADPFEHRRFLDPLVYRSLVIKVCFVGAESTGKTTLAAALAEHYETVWMPEYGRELFEQKEGNLEFDDLYEIAKEHLRRENELAAQAKRFLFCDTNALATEFWSDFYFGRCDQRLVELVRKVEKDYVYVLCGDDISWFQDGWRETGGGDFWREHQRVIRADLEQRGLAYFEASGTLDERVQSVAHWLEETFLVASPRTGG